MKTKCIALKSATFTLPDGSKRTVASGGEIELWGNTLEYAVREGFVTHPGMPGHSARMAGLDRRNVLLSVANGGKSREMTTPAALGIPKA